MVGSYRNYIIVFSTENRRGNFLCKTKKLSYYDILRIKMEIAREFRIEGESIIIENIIELK